MRDFLRRGGWVFLGLVIVGSALVGGIYSLVAGGSNNQNSSSSCPVKKVAVQKPGKNGKYEGTKLVDFTPTKSPGYVQCWDIKVGTGPAATANSTITANYTGALAANGKIFQSSLDTGQPFTQALSQLIPGWQSGIPGMKAGGTRRLLIPAQYAYGPQAQAGIPANSDLVFDISLIAVK